MKKIMFNDAFGLTDKVLAGTKTSTIRSINLSQWEKDSLEGKFENSRLGTDEAYSKLKYGYGEMVSIGMKYKDIPGLPESFSKEKGWTNKMFVAPRLMPRKIQITNSRIVRLNSLTYSDIIKEGIELRDGKYIVEKNGTVAFSGNDPIDAYEYLIDRISGKGTWESNPYVAQYYFMLVADNAPMEAGDMLVINGVSAEIDRKLKSMGYHDINPMIATSELKRYTVCSSDGYYYTGFFPYASTEGYGRIRIAENIGDIDKKLYNKNKI